MAVRSSGPPDIKRTPLTLEALLAYAHLLAILTLVVFISSEAALCRTEWMDAKIVERSARWT